MTTLADVARLSATSRSTASRALKDDPRISRATVERVRLVAEALGYRPNHAARSLATGRNGILGLVLPTTHISGDPYAAQLVGTVTAAATAAGQATMLWLSHEQPGGGVRSILQSGLVDGVVVSIIAQDDPWAEALLESSLPCVSIGRYIGHEDVSYATVDNVTGTRALMVHLREQGYARIATIRGPVGNADADERFAVYVEGIGGPAAIDHNLVAHGGFSYQGGYAAAKALLRHRPDCIVAANDHAALGAVDAIREAGLSVPHDVGVSGWDDMRALSRPDVGLTTVHQDVEGVGREAVTILLELLDGATGPIHRTLPAELVVRGSTTRRAPADDAGGAMQR